MLGAACITVAPFLFSLVDAGSGYGSLVPGMVVLGIGIGSFYPTATTAGVTSVDESQTSLAGGIVYMFQIAGGSIGLGLTTTVFSAPGSFVDGIQAAFRLDAALSLVGFLIALFFVGGRLIAPPPASRLSLRSPDASSPGRRRRVDARPAAQDVVARAAEERRRRRGRRAATSSPSRPISLSSPVAAAQFVRARAADRMSSPGAAPHRHRDLRPRARP